LVLPCGPPYNWLGCSNFLVETPFFFVFFTEVKRLGLTEPEEFCSGYNDCWDYWCDCCIYAWAWLEETGFFLTIIEEDYDGCISGETAFKTFEGVPEDWLVLALPLLFYMTPLRLFSLVACAFYNPVDYDYLIFDCYSTFC